MSEIRESSLHGHAFKFACDPGHNASYFCFEDEQVVRERWWHVREGEVVLDVGAAFGSYALPALAAGAARVVCWSPENHAPLLRESLEANGWADRADVLESGVWSRNGWLVAREAAAMPEFHAERPAEWGDAIPPSAFAVVTLDDWAAFIGLLPAHSEGVGTLADLGRVDWIKIDVEGAEEDVLRGGIELIKAYRPRILVENHLFKDAALKDRCAAVLAGIGYREEGTVPYHAISHSLYLP